MAFYLYKGLKKPLVFYGLKDKYIYYAIGVALASVIIAAIVSSFIGIFGTLSGLGLGAFGIWMVFKTQDKKGLFNKTKNEGGIYVFPKRFKNKNLLHYYDKKNKFF